MNKKYSFIFVSFLTFVCLSFVSLTHTTPAQAISLQEFIQTYLRSQSPTPTPTIASRAPKGAEITCTKEEYDDWTCDSCQTCGSTANTCNDKTYWSACSKTCGGGLKTEFNSCTGDPVGWDYCNTDPCPVSPEPTQPPANQTPNPTEAPEPTEPPNPNCDESSCSGWSAGSCGAGSCADNEREYTRSCSTPCSETSCRQECGGGTGGGGTGGGGGTVTNYRYICSTDKHTVRKWTLTDPSTKVGDFDCANRSKSCTAGARVETANDTTALDQLCTLAPLTPSTTVTPPPNGGACGCAPSRVYDTGGSVHACETPDPRSGRSGVVIRENNVNYAKVFYCSTNGVPPLGNCGCAQKSEFTLSYLHTESECLGVNNIYQNRCILPISLNEDISGHTFRWVDGVCKVTDYFCDTTTPTPANIPSMTLSDWAGDYVRSLVDPGGYSRLDINGDSTINLLDYWVLWNQWKGVLPTPDPG